MVQNAMNAMSEGGKLTIATYTAENELGIRIKDTGSGISKENLNKIFEPFYTTHGRGTGLGLSISRRIIQDHEGSITINSKIGKGTTVYITLPLT